MLYIYQPCYDENVSFLNEGEKMGYEPFEEEKFFFSTRTPHQWSSGPSVHYFNKNMEPLRSLEEAKELALEHQQGAPGLESYVQVSWGVEIALKHSYKP